MKKITLMCSLFISGLVMNAQQITPSQNLEGTNEVEVRGGGGEITLSHSQDQTLVQGMVACAGPTGAPVYTTENSWFRSYTPSEEGVTEGFTITSVGTGVSYTNNSGAGDVEFPITVNAWTSDDEFPLGNFTLIATGSMMVTSADALLPLTIPFDEEVNVGADTEIIVQVSIPTGNPEVDTNLPGPFDIRVGGNDLGQDAPTYLASESCSLPDPTDAAAIGFPDAHAIINLNGRDELLNVGENALEQIAIFPNPASDILNVRTPASLEITSAVIYDVLGKASNVQVVNGQINVSNLSRGVYILNLNTTAGTLTEKIVKQ